MKSKTNRASAACTNYWGVFHLAKCHYRQEFDKQKLKIIPFLPITARVMPDNAEACLFNHGWYRFN